MFCVKKVTGLGVLAAATLAMAGGVVAAIQPTAINTLAGRWAGPGTLTDGSGPGERFKCVVTYFPADDGMHIDQKLRCKGVSYKLDAATRLRVEGERITGSWQDNIHSLDGTVSGALTKNGFVIKLDGQFFAADMKVVSSKCNQAVTVVATKGASDTMAATLKRC
jgi:hypothetical protein